MKCWRLMMLLGVCALPCLLPAEENKEIHDELRALRNGMIAAIDKGDIDQMTSFLATNCVVTWQDATVSRGRDGVRAYYDRMMTGPGRIVQSFKTSVAVDELTILYNDDTGISFGTSVDQFKLTGGLNFELHGRWSATLVKQEGRWLIASCHMSTNLFNNPLLNAAKRTVYWAGGLCLVAGIILGLLVARKRK